MRVLITSPYGKDKLANAFRDAGAEVVKTLAEQPELIVPTVDEELPFFALNRAWFESLGITVMVASENTVYHCRDKAEFNLFCKRHDFQTPRTWHMPCYIKPRFGKGGRGMTKIDTSYIVQEACDWPEVSIDYLADWDGTPVSIIPRYRLDVVNGASTDMETIPGFDYHEVERLGRELGLVGHNVIQGFLSPSGSFLFSEVNPRFGGGSPLTFDIFNSPKFLMENMCSSTKKQSIISPHS